MDTVNSFVRDTRCGYRHVRKMGYGRPSGLGKLYGVLLFLSCLAAAMLGYSCGATPELSPVDRTRVTDIFSIEQEGTVEAQGSYVAINDRMLPDKE